MSMNHTMERDVSVSLLAAEEQDLSCISRLALRFSCHVRATKAESVMSRSFF